MNKPKPLPDIAVNIPYELLESFSEVIKIGLQRAKINPENRKSLSTWWEVEYDLIQSEISNK